MWIFEMYLIHEIDVSYPMLVPLIIAIMSCIIYWYLVLDNLEFKHKNWTEFMHFQTNIYDDYLEFFRHSD